MLLVAYINRKIFENPLPAYVEQLFSEHLISSKLYIYLDYYLL